MADLSPWGRPAGVSSRTLPGGLHPLAGNRTGLCAVATCAVRTRSDEGTRPARRKEKGPRADAAPRRGSFQSRVTDAERSVRAVQKP